MCGAASISVDLAAGDRGDKRVLPSRDRRGYCGPPPGRHRGSHFDQVDARDVVVMAGGAELVERGAHQPSETAK